MARTYAQIYLTIWNDPDFRDCTSDAQWLYFTMLTHPTLTSCGVMDWRPARLAAMSHGMTVERLQHAAWELGQKHLIAVDPDTEEALVRSFVRHDGILKSPNKTKALVREYGGIASQKIMELVSNEVRRAGEEDPTLNGLEVAKPVSKQFMEPFQIGSPTVPDWFQNSSESVPFQDHQKTGNPSKSVPPPSSLIPQPPTDVGVGEDEPARAPKQKETSLPPTWEPTPSHQEQATKLGLDLEWETESFKDKALAKGWTYVNWNSGFATWLRQQKRFNQRDGITTGSQPSGPTMTANEVPDDW